MSYVPPIERHGEQARLLRDETRGDLRTKLTVRVPPTGTPAVRATTAVPEVVNQPLALYGEDRLKAARLEDVDWTSVLVNGAAVDLLTLSTSGAEIRSSTALQPGDAVAVTLKHGTDTMLFDARVVWGVPETIAGDRFRAGLTFASKDRPGIERLHSSR